jgi:hypothetical protein
MAACSAATGLAEQHEPELVQAQQDQQDARQALRRGLRPQPPCCHDADNQQQHGRHRMGQSHAGRQHHQVAQAQHHRRACQLAARHAALREPSRADREQQQAAHARHGKQQRRRHGSQAGRRLPPEEAGRHRSEDQRRGTQRAQEDLLAVAAPDHDQRQPDDDIDQRIGE